jgi:hypothetical protein
MRSLDARRATVGLAFLCQVSDAHVALQSQVSTVRVTLVVQDSLRRHAAAIVRFRMYANPSVVIFVDPHKATSGDLAASFQTLDRLIKQHRIGIVNEKDAFPIPARARPDELVVMSQFLDALRTSRRRFIEGIGEVNAIDIQHGRDGSLRVLDAEARPNPPP